MFILNTCYYPNFVQLSLYLLSIIQFLDWKELVQNKIHLIVRYCRILECANRQCITLVKFRSNLELNYCFHRSSYQNRVFQITWTTLMFNLTCATRTFLFPLTLYSFFSPAALISTCWKPLATPPGT